MDLKVYCVPEGEHRAGYWTFSIDGRPSLFYSSTEAGLGARLVLLIEGRQPGTVQLPAMRLAAGVQGDVTLDDGPQGEHWAQLPTVAERVEAFMSRGKLGKE